MKRKPLTGREASILSIFAQCLKMSKEEADKLLGALKGDALKIGRAMLGRDKKPTKHIKEAADGFFEWAKSLKRGKNI